MIPPGFQAQIIGGLSAFNGALGHLLAQRMGNRCDPFQLDASILEANMCFTDLAAINAYLGNPAAENGHQSLPAHVSIGYLAL